MQLQAVLDSHSEVFRDGLGAIKGFTATIPNYASRFFYPARSVAYSFCEQAKQELGRLTLGVLEPVEVPEWAAPIVAVLKSDNKGASLHICGDFRVTVNPVLKLDCYIQRQLISASCENLD